MQDSIHDFEITLKKEYGVLSEELSEKGRRKWAALQAQKLGFGGKGVVHRATGLDYKTINRGLKEIDNVDGLEKGRIRERGGGRKRLTDRQPDILSSLEMLVESSTCGDPQTVLKWTSKSVAHLHEALVQKGFRISPKSVYNLLIELGYSLQTNRKVIEGGAHPDRDAQFSFIHNKVTAFQQDGLPVISVDTKKKELVGNYKNAGREYHKKGQSPAVNIYDFLDKEKGKVAPYGVYDLDKNKGWVSVGVSSDTAEFAVNSIRSWWEKMGQKHYAKAAAIYINADGGGSNGTRNRLWKKELQKFADEIDKEIHISHFSPGTSKWNKIEHRMFCFISKNWRGKPLIDTATVVSLIGNTKTNTGLEISAELDERSYQKGVKVSDKELAEINLHKENFHGEWNYVIKPN